MQATAAPVIVIAVGIVGAYYAAGQDSSGSAWPSWRSFR